MVYYVPCFSLALEAGAPTVPLRTRDVIQVIASLVWRVDPSSLDFEKKTGPAWGEYCTSEQYAKMYDACRRAHPNRSSRTGEYCVPLALMIMADKFAEGRLKKTSCYPVYITLMNILASVRYRPSSVALLALLPHFPSSKVKIAPNTKTGHACAPYTTALRSSLIL